MSGKSPSVISLFAGTGGSSLGYHWAGFKELLAVDFDEHAEQSFKLNFPTVKFWRGDVSTLTGDSLRELSGLQNGSLDVLDGSPPCQGFSTSGKRNVSDSRNSLTSQFIRLIHELKPRAFVMENVPGMASGKMRGLWKQIWNEFPHDDYQIKAKVCNAANYGVPQSRHRLFVIGAREFTPTFPKHHDKIITVKEAIGHLKPTERFELKGNYGNLYHAIPYGKSAMCILNKGFESCHKLHPNKPSHTIKKTQTKHGFATLVHYDEPRPIAINEALVLSSFPETWKLEGTYEQKWARIGNAVMPKMMQAIAEELKRGLGY